MMPSNPEQFRELRAQTLARLKVCADVTAQLNAAKAALNKALDAGPLDAVKLICSALFAFMDTQQIQLDQNQKENEKVVAQCDAVLAQLASPIVRPGQGPRQ